MLWSQHLKSHFSIRNDITLPRCHVGSSTTATIIADVYQAPNCARHAADPFQLFSFTEKETGAPTNNVSLLTTMDGRRRRGHATSQRAWCPPEFLSSPAQVQGALPITYFLSASESPFPPTPVRCPPWMPPRPCGALPGAIAAGLGQAPPFGGPLSAGEVTSLSMPSQSDG